MIPYKFLAVPALLMLGAASLSADTLVMQDGRRLQGELVSVSRGVVVFDQQRDTDNTYRRARRIRVNLSEVSSIDFGEMDDDGTYDNSSDPFGRDRPSDYRNDRWRSRERQVNVSALEPWTDTGIDLRAGDTVHFTADGSVIWGPGRQDGPEGEINSPVNRARPIPGRPAAALIGRVGTSSRDVFFIGAERGPFRVNNTGRLYLGINDDYLEDNSGSLRVTVQR